MGIKYFVNENFFALWSAEMAYVLGYLYADGSLEDASYLRGKYVRVSSIDKSSIVKIRALMQSEHTIVLRRREKPFRPQYLLRIGNHKLYGDLSALGLYPNKSLTITFPSVPKEYFSHFLRGYFDGDGCVFLERSKGITRAKIVRRLAVIFTSGSKKFLEALDDYLSEFLGTKKGSVYRNGNAYQARYQTKDSIKIFKFFYTTAPKKGYLERKLKIFIKYFILRPSKIDESVARALYNTGYGHVVK